jgi:catechol-2,3-dioxygenase
MIQCRRLGYAVLSTPDLDRQIRYYGDVLGLYLADRDSRRAVLSTRQGLECVVLEQQDSVSPGLTGLSFQIDPKTSLEDAQRALAKSGVKSEIRQGRTANVGRVVAFKDPKGTGIELFNGIAFADADQEERGVGILKLGHVAYQAPNVMELTTFWCDVLGFRKSDWRGENAMFLRCGVDHHTINFFKGEALALHHLAFEVKDFPELVRASDLLARKELPLDWGPARHTIGHNCACYHANPDGLRIELYAEMDQMKDEALGYFEPRPWHEDRPQYPKDWLGHSSPRNKWIPGAP